MCIFSQKKKILHPSFYTKILKKKIEIKKHRVLFIHILCQSAPAYSSTRRAFAITLYIYMCTHTRVPYIRILYSHIRRMSGRIINSNYGGCKISVKVLRGSSIYVFVRTRRRNNDLRKNTQLR